MSQLKLLSSKCMKYGRQKTYIKKKFRAPDNTWR